MIRKTYELQTSVADQNDVLAAVLDFIDIPFDDDENKTLQWSIVNTEWNCYLEVGDEDTYTRLYECDLCDLNISMETILDALVLTADRAFDSIEDLDRDLFLKYES